MSDKPMDAEPDIKVVAVRHFTLACDVAISAAGHRWRFPNAYASWSVDVYGSIDEAFAGAQLFAQEHMVPISPAPAGALSATQPGCAPIDL